VNAVFIPEWARPVHIRACDVGSTSERSPLGSAQGEKPNKAEARFEIIEGSSKGRTKGASALALSHGEAPFWHTKLKDSTIATKSDADRESLTEVHELFAQARDIRFEDGMESDFSRRLQDLVARGGSAAVSAIERVILCGAASAEVSGEALRWIGRMVDPGTLSERRRLLLRSLYSPTYAIRDGAILGLMSLDQPVPQTLIARIIEREPRPELRRDLEELVEYLGS
jgi:hypothetical protein